MEPREAARVLFPLLPHSDGLAKELDSIARRGDAHAIESRADQITSSTLGVTLSDLRRLRDATVLLRNRRTGK